MISALFFLAPDPLSRHCSRIWIQQYVFFPEPQSFFRIPRSVHTIGIFQLFNIQPKNDHGIYIPDPVFIRKRQHRIRFFLSPVEQQKFTGSSAGRVHGKIHPHRKRRRSVRLKHPRSYKITGDLAHRIKRSVGFYCITFHIMFHHRSPLSGNAFPPQNRLFPSVFHDPEARFLHVLPRSGAR